MKDFRQHLQEELVNRCRRNPGYSLRAFAKSLGINHGILSLILNKKRPITALMVRDIGLALGLKKSELDQYVLSIDSSRKQTQSRTRETKKINQLTMDVFSIVSDWYYDAIIELSRIPGFEGTAHFISTKLGITVSEARVAIERLERVGLISILEDGTWEEILGDTTTAINVDNTSVALRNYQKQILSLSLKALENIPKTERDHSSNTMAIDKADLQEAKEMIKKFRFDLMHFLQRKGTSPTDVYQLAVSFYPLTMKDNKK